MTIDTGRRDALRKITAGTLALGASRYIAFGEPLARPVVARAKREALAKNPNDGAAVGAALGAVVARAAGEKNATDAMRRLFRPSDVVAIKVNCIAGRNLSPQPPAAWALARWLQQAGVPGRQIVIWDRTTRELKDAGYEPGEGPGGVRVIGTDDAYDTALLEWGPAASRLAKFLGDVTAMINLGVVKDHGLAGVSIGMKSWYGAIHNPNKLHDDGCNPFIPYLAAAKPLRDRLRLTVIDGTRAVCEGGPGFRARWAFPYGGFLASCDPVAIDAVGWREVEAQRKSVGLPTLTAAGREPRYIATAATLGLGVDDPAKFALEDV